MTHPLIMNEHHVLTLGASMRMINERHCHIMVCMLNERQEVDNDSSSGE